MNSIIYFNLTNVFEQMKFSVKSAQTAHFCPILVYNSLWPLCKSLCALC